jgi:methionyl-tRNA formyltransferase
MGVHPSLLPKYRGAAPVAWALLNGETATGVTIFRLNERLDAGEVLLQERVPIRPGEPADSLSGRLARLGADALVTALDRIAEGGAQFVPQDDAGASLAPKLTKAQGRIDWRQPAEAIERLVRATTPWPGATTAWHGEALKVLAVRVGEPPAGDHAPGTVTSAGASSLVVATGRGTLAITELQLPGRRRMTVNEFLAGHHIHVGEQLGDA